MVADDEVLPNRLSFMMYNNDNTFCYFTHSTGTKLFEKDKSGSCSINQNLPFVLFYYNHRGEMETHIQELCIEWNSENRSHVLSEMY